MSVLTIAAPPRSTVHQRAAWLMTPVVVAAAMGLGAVPALSQDTGTAIHRRTDMRSFLEGTTSEPKPNVEGGTKSAPRETHMVRIRRLSGLSQRRCASLFGVTHTTIANWETTDPPDLEQLIDVLDALEHARGLRADVPAWLTKPLPGMNVRPVDLLSQKRFRAFKGALRARPATTPSLSSNELLDLRKDDPSWAASEISRDPDGID